MEWGWIVIYALAILGAALIGGGTVAYRGSSSNGIRSLAASSIAGGVMMWMVVLMVVPASITSTGPSAPAVESARLATETLAK